VQLANLLDWPTPMTERGLQVTYRRGQLLAAYLTLAHPTGQKVSRTHANVDGLLIVDFASNGAPIGIEITAPRKVTLVALNELLAELGEVALSEQDYAPVAMQ
jgi:hypothetical protein